MMVFRHVFMALLLVACCLPQAKAFTQRNILYITSYDMSFPTVNRQLEGLRSVLNADSVAIDVEEMDCKRFPEAGNVSSFEERLAFKLARLPRYDVAVVADDNAFAFALSRQDSLFAGVPVVFLGVNNERMAMKQESNPGMTGVVESLGLNGTIRLMKKLFPNSPRAIAISDGTLTGRADSDAFSSAATLAWSDYEIIDLSGISFEALADTLRLIPADIPVLLLSAYTDCHGETKSFYESLNLITSNLQSSLFHLWSHGLGRGVLGGQMVSQYEQGQAAGRMVARLLAGEDVASIPINNANKLYYVFDYNELVRFGIDTSALPAGSRIINEPPGLFSSESKYWPYTLIAAVVVLMVVVFMAISSIRNRKLKRYLKITNQTVNALNEELVRSKEEADRLNAYRGAFIENLARELKAPINTIDDFTEILSTPGLKQEEIIGYGKIISHSALKMKQAIDDIADFSKSYSSGARVNVGDVCINDLLRDIYEDFKIIVSERAVAINMVLPLKDEDSHIVSDRERISKIIYHLLDNALKYTAQGKITFGYRIADDGKNILISVNDTGIGIPQRRQMLLTQIFDGHQPDLLNLHEKMGLGLTIAQRNAQLLQGTLTFKSTQGVGTTFTLRLPLKIDDNVNGSGAVIADPNYPTVLIVEAESTSFLYLKVLMERLGTNVWLVHAHNADEALMACNTKNINMVLAGVNLSSDGGLKAIESIRAYSAVLPIVAVLPSNSKSQVEDAMTAGANDYLVKPVNRDDLLAMCRKHLSGFPAFTSKLQGK